MNTVDLYQISLVILSYILGNLQKIYCIPAIHCYFFVKLVCESGFSKGAKKGKKNIDCRLWQYPSSCPKYSKNLIFDLIWTFRILRIQDLNIFELWNSVFASIRFELRIFRISRIYSTPWLGLIFEWNWAELAVLISW